MASLPLVPRSRSLRSRDFGYELRLDPARPVIWGRSLVGAAVGGLVGLVLWCALLALPFLWAHSSSTVFNLAGSLFVLAVLGGGVHGALSDRAR